MTVLVPFASEVRVRSCCKSITNFGSGSTGRSVPDESDDILDRSHRFGSQLLRALGAARQYRIDIGRVVVEAAHLGIERGKLGDQKLNQRVLEGRELGAAKLLERACLVRPRKRCIDADEIVGLGTLGELLLVVRQR